MPVPILETTDVDFMRRQFAAWMDGVNWRLAGHKLSECPFAARSAEGDAFENGWEIVDLELRRTDMVIRAAKSLLLAATGPDDGPTKWTEARDRWLRHAPG